MGYDLNQCSFTGRLGRDPEMRTAGSTNVCSFSIAIDDSYKDKSGNKVDGTVWLDVELWGKFGEVMSQYIAKGQRIAVAGELKLDQWQDKQTGAQRYKHKLRATSLHTLEKAGDEQAGQPQQRSTAPQGDTEPAHDVSDDDIPF